jgi:alkanesulfonate monooxygenase SsuD/methylene tetrahydromethanopterin reductase-like flavin-dependent oxidoreductase (luciferase family)
MKFGVLYVHQHPKPWLPGGEAKLLSEALDQVELADRLGYHSAWEVEHHFLEEYSHSSAPEIFLAAASQRTKNIRLGHGIKLMPPAYNSPARVAEQIATLDIVSNGRVEFGTGESGSRAELEGFNIHPNDKREQWLETTEQVANMLAMTPYPGYQGKHFSMPARNIVPKPVQAPHPPLWVACSNRETIRLAARLGIGALTFTFVEPPEAKKWIDDYYSIFKSECVPIGHTVNPNVALVAGFSVHPDEQTALDRGIEGLQYFQFAAAQYYREGDMVPGHTNVWDRYAAQRDEIVRNEFLHKISAPDTGGGVGGNRGVIGTPDQVRATIRSLQAVGADQVVFIQQAGRNKHEDICSSLELFANDIMPEFVAQDADRQAAKEAELQPYIEQAFARKKWLKPAGLDDLPTVRPYGKEIYEVAPNFSNMIMPRLADE